tara:strand:+ start:13088 stop:13459 length:372 start_codon:yes stop_codon:yes gene_type:complete
MTIKLYHWDVSQKDVLANPSKFSGAYKIKWHVHGYVSMTVEFAALFNSLNNNVLTKSNADGVAAVKAACKPDLDRQKVAAIRKEYSVDDEFFALRTNNTTVKNRIAAIISDIETERDSWLDVS